MKKPVYSFLGICSVAACVPTGTQAQSNKTEQSENPNIVLIIADDMGWGDLGCYGNAYTKTPNIDRLASKGVRFTQGYAGSAVSSPSRCSLITGMHTGHTRIRNNFVAAEGIEGKKGDKTIRRQGLKAEDVTLPQLLKPRGYVSGVINKWHLDGFDTQAGPLDRGFDEFKGWLVSTSYSNDPYYYPEWRFHGRELIKIKENENGVQARHNNDISTEEAIDFMKKHRHESFFLYLAYDSPHEP
ncbi:sulfatase-like hydrolase/transferase, partial [Bacteroidales bacterium OttesenSCG-928-J19]|nr:sulfatase-like hydrolase/transferase [Bacteroidales bacterium OttesenSCG-928-J19]MDL2243321.1 sulfatase-like hydrolase/transferase [Bacteroidales bacterium OttesenSCG-928-J19]